MKLSLNLLKIAIKKHHEAKQVDDSKLMSNINEAVVHRYPSSYLFLFKMVDVHTGFYRSPT